MIRKNEFFDEVVNRILSNVHIDSDGFSEIADGHILSVVSKEQIESIADDICEEWKDSITLENMCKKVSKRLTEYAKINGIPINKR